MSNFGLEKILGLLNKKACILVVNVGFLYAAFGLSFMVCYAQSSSSDTQDASKYINASFFENIKPQKYNTWFGIEDGLHYMKIQKSWEEALPIPQNRVQDVSQKNTALSAKNDTSTPAQYETIVVSIDILKFSPRDFDFSVYSALWDGGKTKTLAEWSADENLIAAINASMFLPDGITSNGYLRKNLSLNNKIKATKLGGFFVADPKNNQEKSHGEKELPHAAIIYKNDPNLSRFTDDEDLDFEDILDKYNVVVQNFKLLEIEHWEILEVFPSGADGKFADFPDVVAIDVARPANPKTTNWKSNRRHSITAIAEDVDGNIFFLHSQTPLTVQNFIKAIKNDSSLNLCRALYTEGGGQANMSLTVNNIAKYWFGQNSFLHMLTGHDRLPNIIGVKRK